MMTSEGSKSGPDTPENEEIDLTKSEKVDRLREKLKEDVKGKPKPRKRGN